VDGVQNTFHPNINEPAYNNMVKSLGSTSITV